jgi:hypothetical protein
VYGNSTKQTYGGLTMPNTNSAADNRQHRQTETERRDTIEAARRIQRTASPDHRMTRIIAAYYALYAISRKGA